MSPAGRYAPDVSCRNIRRLRVLDLLSGRVVTDEILVLNEGKVVERGATKAVLQHPTDSYTVKLLDAGADTGAAA